MSERNGQGVFIGVTVAVMCLAGLLFFFPDTPTDEGQPGNLSGQVIIPRTTSPGTTTLPRNRSPKQPAPKKRQTPSDPNEIWQVIYLGKDRIGYSRTNFESVTLDGKARIRTTSELQMSIKRFGQTTRSQIRSESLEMPDGDLISFRIRSGNERTGSKVVGRLERGRLVIETTQRGQTERRSYPWRKGIKAPMFQDRLARSSPMRPGEIRRFDTFLPELGRVTQIRLAAEGLRNVTDRDGKTRKLLRVRVSQSVSPTEVVDVYLDKRGWPAISESDFIGKKLRHYTVSKAEALRAIEGTELDLGVSTLIRVAAIRNAHTRRKIVYRIFMKDGDPAKYLPEGGAQTVRRIDPETVDLTVEAVQPSKRRLHVRVDRKFVNPSRFLQSSDKRVLDHARRAAGYDADPMRAAMKMEKYVHENIRSKNFSTAMGSAAEVAKRMEGDCTEHAVLLAAMLRAQRIPSRIAIGLVYVPRISSFGAHMWTEAWIGGKWIPLDAALGQGGCGGGHIKLADASFADDSPDPITAFVPLMNVLGRWRIEVRRVE